MTTSSSTSPSKAPFAYAPATIGGPTLPRNTASNEVERDLRFARALRKRRADIRGEMESCLQQRADAYAFAEACLDEFDDLAETDQRLRKAFSLVEERLHRAGAYFVSDQQVRTILDEIAEVGADTRRFCAYMGVAAVARIPAHQFDDALAALGRKRRRVA